METREQTLTLAKTMLEEGDPNGALGVLEEYLRLYDGDSEAHALAGVAYGQLGIYYLAARHLGHSLAVNDNQNNVRLMLLRALIEMRRWDDALPVAERLKRDNPNSSMIATLYESVIENAQLPETGWSRTKTRLDATITFARDNNVFEDEG
ncbi:MAG TPA: hypothetical protein VNK96_06075 [Fimbriimonadales bacterium]|nr:hypothetical protein [Fimbriimonadales bacterium]